MPLNLKDLIVVLFLSTIVFILIKRTALIFCNERDFIRRRNAYYVLSCAAFLSPSFWVYAIVAVPALWMVGRRDTNPGAAYLFLLYVVPPVVVPTPIFGMRSFIDFNNQLLLSLLVVIPAMWRRKKSGALSNASRMQFVDWIFLVFGILSSVLYLHVLQSNGVPYPSTFTDFLRHVVVFMIVGFAPYFLLSRTSSSRQAMLDYAAAFLIPGVVMSAIAIFETLKGWLLYEVIPEYWGVASSITSFLMRGNSLRAMASAGHSLALGYLLDVAFGIWLALSHYVPSRLTRVAISVLLMLGLFAAYSRGPWACAVLIYFAFAIQKPNALSGFAKALVAAVAMAVVLALSPLGAKIAAVVPFLGGNVDVENIYYRERLWDRIWMLFQGSPLLGDQFALSKMQDLRQGQGIVDFVNGYAAEMVSAGSVGLGLFLIFTLAILLKTLRAVRATKLADRQLGMVGAGLSSCILGTLFLWAFGGPTEVTLWALLALGLGFSHIAATYRAMPAKHTS